MLVFLRYELYFLYEKKIQLSEEANQTVVGLLNSACSKLHQYVVLNSCFFRERLSLLSFSEKSTLAPLAQLDRATAF